MNRAMVHGVFSPYRGVTVAACATMGRKIRLAKGAPPRWDYKWGVRMSKANLKIHLFRVNPWEGAEQLHDLLARINDTALEDRIRHCGGGDYRLEDITPPAAGGSLWELNFVRLRSDHGPGKVSLTEPLAGFDMTEDDFFGEDTAVLYDQNTRYAVVQYNHWGVRPRAIEQYLSAYREDVNNIYALRVKLDLNAERKYQDQAIQRRVEIGIDLTKMQGADLHARRSLTQLAEIGRELGADRLYLTVTVASGARENSLRNEAKQMVTSAMHWLGGNRDALRTLKSYGASDGNKPYEEIDLLEEKLEHNEEVDVGLDRRIALPNRIRALKRAKAAWVALMTND